MLTVVNSSCQQLTIDRLIRKILILVLQRAKMRNRDKNGRFTEFSNLDKKSFGVRLYKDDRVKLEALSEERGVAPGVLVREILNKWLENPENFNNPISA